MHNHSESTVRVLLVEDNDVDAEGIQRAFQKQKIANPITRAANGEVALQMLRNGEIQRPFLILLDLNMPVMDGIEFLKHLRADPELHDGVVFVLTTSKRDEDKFAAYDLNVAGYMVKSNVGHDFLSLTAMLDNYWRVVELPPARD